MTEEFVEEPLFTDPEPIGQCPVQVEGTIKDQRDGSVRQYYFRARGSHITMQIGAPNDATEYAAVNGEYIFEAEVNTDFGCGWMPHELARDLARWVLSETIAHWKRPKREPTWDELLEPSE